MDFLRQRRDLVKHLRERGITDERVLSAISVVPREEFVPVGWRSQAYDDRALPIDLNQTISQPLTVAAMCSALQLGGDEVVLEIGTGSGYGAAVLARIARTVYTVERHQPLAEAAAERLTRLGFDNVHVRCGDGSLGWPDAAPFAGIIVTAGGNHLPLAYGAQLVEGGRIVIPLGPTPHRQTLYRYTLREGRLVCESLGEYAFVPLIGADAWRDDDEE